MEKSNVEEVGISSSVHGSYRNLIDRIGRLPRDENYEKS
jgi:hypothetical protein